MKFEQQKMDDKLTRDEWRLKSDGGLSVIDDMMIAERVADD